jgi:hypothetical protein
MTPDKLPPRSVGMKTPLRNLIETTTPISERKGKHKEKPINAILEVLEAPDSSEAEGPASNNSTMGSDIETDPTLKLFLKDRGNEINRDQQFMGRLEQIEKRIRDSNIEFKERFMTHLKIHLKTELQSVAEELLNLKIKTQSVSEVQLNMKTDIQSVAEEQLSTSTYLKELQSTSEERLNLKTELQSLSEELVNMKTELQSVAEEQLSTLIYLKELQSTSEEHLNLKTELQSLSEEQLNMKTELQSVAEEQLGTSMYLKELQNTSEEQLKKILDGRFFVNKKQFVLNLVMIFTLPIMLSVVQSIDAADHLNHLHDLVILGKMMLFSTVSHVASLAEDFFHSIADCIGSLK